MSWRDDMHGRVFASGECKLYNPSHTWAMKLAQLHRQTGYVRIVTSTIVDEQYVIENILAKRPARMSIVCDVSAHDAAQIVKARYPEVRVGISPGVGSNIVLIEPETIYVSSCPLGKARDHEVTIGVRSREAHDTYVSESFEPLWLSCREL